MCSDITAQRLAQLEVMNIYNNIPGAVFRCRFDPDFSVIDANDGLFDFLGYSREEFEMCIRDRVAAEPRLTGVLSTKGSL